MVSSKASTGSTTSISQRLQLPKLAAVPKLDSSGVEHQAIFNLVNAILGVGVLGYPFCYRSCGLLLATALVLVCQYASQLSIQFLLLASQVSGKRRYEDLARECFGQWGQHAVTACIFALNLGCIVAYVNILADMLSSVAGSIIPPGAEPSRNLLMTGVTLGGALPVAMLVRRPQLLSLLSQASVGFLILFAAVIAYFAVSPIQNAGKVLLWRWDGVLVAFPVVAYGFTAHTNVLTIQTSLRAVGPTAVNRMMGIIRKALLLCSILYCTVGVSGYLAFRQRTSGDLLRNLGAASVSSVRVAYERVLKLGYGVSILGTLPLLVLPLHEMFIPSLGLSGEDGLPLMLPQGLTSGQQSGSPTRRQAVPLGWQQQGITVAVLGVALAVAVFVPNVEFIFGLTGATASVLIAYILPPLAFLHASGSPKISAATPELDLRPGSAQWSAMRRRAWLLLLFGVVVGLTCTRATLSAVREEAEVVQLAQQLAAQEAKEVVAGKVETAVKQTAVVAGAVSQAGAALQEAAGHANDTLQQAANAVEALSSLTGAGPPAAAGSGGDDAAEAHAAVANAMALGAVNANVQEMRRSVNSSLTAFENVTASLGAAAVQLRKDKDENAQRLIDEQIEGSLSDGSKPPSNNTKLDEKNARAAEVAKELAASMAADSVPHDETRAAATVDEVYARANETLSALKRASEALDAVEKAVEAVEKSQGSGSVEERKNATNLVHAAVNETNVAAQNVESSMSSLKEVHEAKSTELATLTTQLAQQASEVIDPSKLSLLPLFGNGTTSAFGVISMNSTIAADAPSGNDGFAESVKMETDANNIETNFQPGIAPLGPAALSP